MIEITEQRGPFVHLEAKGRIRREDYETLVPELEQQIEAEGRLRCLIHLHQIHRVELGAALEDLKFGLRHRHDFERCAVVGDSELERWATVLARPFYGGEVRYFDEAEAAAARRWTQQPTTV